MRSPYSHKLNTTPLHLLSLQIVSFKTPPKHLNYWPLWCGKEVYWIAEELQLLNPSLFKNIFLGLGVSIWKRSEYSAEIVTSKSAELEVCLLRMKYLVQKLFSQFCLEGTMYVAKRYDDVSGDTTTAEVPRISTFPPRPSTGLCSPMLL